MCGGPTDAFTDIPNRALTSAKDATTENTQRAVRTLTHYHLQTHRRPSDRPSDRPTDRPNDRTRFLQPIRRPFAGTQISVRPGAAFGLPSAAAVRARSVGWWRLEFLDDEIVALLSAWACLSCLIMVCLLAEAWPVSVVEPAGLCCHGNGTWDLSTESLLGLAYGESLQLLTGDEGHDKCTVYLLKYIFISVPNIREQVYTVH